MSFPVPDFTIEEYQRIISRHLFSLGVLSDRVAILTRENVELMAIVDEIQRDLNETRQILSDLRNSEDVLHPGVASEHAVVHPVAGQQSVPGRDGTVPPG